MKMQKNNCNNWNSNLWFVCFSLKGLLSALYGFKTAREKGQNIKNYPCKAAK